MSRTRCHAVYRGLSIAALCDRPGDGELQPDPPPRVRGGGVSPISPAQGKIKNSKSGFAPPLVETPSHVIPPSVNVCSGCVHVFNIQTVREFSVVGTLFWAAPSNSKK